MPVNTRSVARRSAPSGRASIDRRYRVPLPELGWKVGTRVYFSPVEPGKGFMIRKIPGGLLNGRLISRRIQRIGFALSTRVRKKPRRSLPSPISQISELL